MVVIALHGRNQQPNYILDQVVHRLDTKAATSWLLPAAPDRSWYPDRADADSAANERALTQAIARVDFLCDKVARATSAPVILLGFSQGACVACEFAATNGNRLAALIALTGGLTGPDAAGFEAVDLTRPIPALFAAGDSDPWINVDRVHATAAAFAAAGASCTTLISSADTEHHIREAEVAAIADLVDQLLPPPA